MDMSSLNFEKIRIGQMRDYIANKKEENRSKPKLYSNDVLSTMYFNYAVLKLRGSFQKTRVFRTSARHIDIIQTLEYT